MDELGQCTRRGLRSSTRQAGEAREHGLSLLEPDVGNVTAVPRVPAQGRSPELARLVDDPDADEHVLLLVGVSPAEKFRRQIEAG